MRAWQAAERPRRDAVRLVVELDVSAYELDRDPLVHVGAMLDQVVTDIAETHALAGTVTVAGRGAVGTWRLHPTHRGG
jgi:hypothetical protein